MTDIIKVIVEFFDDLYLKKDIILCYDIDFYYDNNIKGYHKKNKNFRQFLD
jgi:hypothetical protein